jgi:hypothetical protein
MISSLSKQNLKRIALVENYLITLDEDGIFDLWVRDVHGEVQFKEGVYAFVNSILPSRLFELLKRNGTKLETR